MFLNNIKTPGHKEKTKIMKNEKRKMKKRLPETSQPATSNQPPANRFVSLNIFRILHCPGRKTTVVRFLIHSYCRRVLPDCATGLGQVTRLEKYTDST